MSDAPICHLTGAQMGDDGGVVVVGGGYKCGGGWRFGTETQTRQRREISFLPAVTKRKKNTFPTNINSVLGNDEQPRRAPLFLTGVFPRHLRRSGRNKEVKRH